MAGFQGKLMGLRLEGQRSQNASKGLWGEAQLGGGVPGTLLGGRRDLASKLHPGINCITLSESLLFMGLSLPIFQVVFKIAFS